MATTLDASLSGNEIDRLVGRARGYTAKVLAGEYADVGSRVFDAYARVFGVAAGWLAYGEGTGPAFLGPARHATHRALREALAQAREAAAQGHGARRGLRPRHERADDRRDLAAVA